MVSYTDKVFAGNISSKCLTNLVRSYERLYNDLSVEFNNV